MKTALFAVGAVVVALATPWACIMGSDLRNAHAEHVLFAECSARLAAAGIDPHNPDRVVPGGLATYCGPIFRAATHYGGPLAARCTDLAVERACPDAWRAGDRCTGRVRHACFTAFPPWAWD
jgi:hypothetical protein